MFVGYLIGYYSIHYRVLSMEYEKDPTAYIMRVLDFFIYGSPVKIYNYVTNALVDCAIINLSQMQDRLCISIPFAPSHKRTTGRKIVRSSRCGAGADHGLLRVAEDATPSSPPSGTFFVCCRIF